MKRVASQDPQPVFAGSARGWPARPRRARAAVLVLAVTLVALPLLSLSAGEKATKPHRPGLEALLKRLGYIPIPLTRARSNHLCVKADVDGKKRLLTVDTGWGVTTLNKSAGRKLPTVESLGAHVVDPVLGSLDDSGLSLVRTLKLGPAQFANEPVRVESLRASEDDETEGILGADFFSRHFCLIDCLDLRLYVRAGEPGAGVAEAITNSLVRSGYRVAPLRKASRSCLSCEFAINAGEATLLVDTGAVLTVIDNAAAIRCKLVWRETSERISGARRDIGTTPVYATSTRIFRAGGVDMPLHGLHLGIADLSDWRMGRKEQGAERLDGALGSDLLAADGALIDFAGRRLWFNPDEK